MRKLLSLLTVLALVTPVPLNVMACGGKTNPTPDADDIDYLTLKQTAEEKIQTEFANLANDGSSLRRENDVTNGAAIMAYLKTTDQKQDTPITEINSKETIDGFLEILRAQVVKISNNLVANYPELKPLFNSINSNDILKINTDDLDTILTNKAFDWQSNDFGLQGFDASKDPYKVTDWYYLNAKLKLDFTCLDENSKVNTTTIDQSYDMYFANDGSNLNQVVTAISANVKSKLDNIKCVNLEYQQWNDSFVNQKDDVLGKIEKELMKNKDLSTITGLKIDTKTITNPYNNDYNYMGTSGVTQDAVGYDPRDPFPLSLPFSNNFIKNSTDFNNAWNPIIAKRENDFVRRLHDWKTKNNITIVNDTKVFVFGEYQTNDWKISGLEIKQLSLPYYITCTNTTRTSNTSDNLKILEKLFVGGDALFQYGENYGSFKYNSEFNVRLNPDTYDDFINRNVTIQTVYDYINNQTIDVGTKDGFIKPTDKVQWTANDTTWLDKPISNVLNNNDVTRNFRLVINGNIFAMAANYRYPYTNFNISRSNINVWPTI